LSTLVSSADLSIRRRYHQPQRPILLTCLNTCQAVVISQFLGSLPKPGLPFSHMGAQTNGAG
jgi:hypothetical protein